MNVKITNKDGVTLKTKGKFCPEDINVSVDESLLSGGGISIPSVTDLTCDSEGNVSWTAPNFDSLADYNPTISYVVSVNGSEIETSNTNVNARNYLIDGVNNVKVDVKAILIKNGTTEIIQYSPPLEASIEILTTTLPYNLSDNKAICIDNCIYIFGGRLSSSKMSNDVIKYDITNDIIETYADVLPSENSYDPILINNELYISKSDAIYKYDLTNNTYELVINFGGSYPHKHYYNGFIYLCTTINIIKYDMTTGTKTTLEQAFSSGSHHYKTVSVLVNDKIYFFTYQSTDAKTYVDVFDMTNETIQEKIFDYKYLQEQNVIYKDGAFYIFGGYESSAEKEAHKIYKLDITTGTFKEMTTVLPNYIYMAILCLNNNDVYIIGSNITKTSYAHYSKQIIRIANINSLN